jgi:hypothetical protein
VLTKLLYRTSAIHKQYALLLKGNCGLVLPEPPPCCDSADKSATIYDGLDGGSNKFKGALSGGTSSAQVSSSFSGRFTRSLTGYCFINFGSNGLRQSTTRSGGMLPYGWDHLRGRNVPAGQPFDSDVQAEMIPKVAFFRGEPVTSTHKKFSLSACLVCMSPSRLDLGKIQRK